MGVESEADRRAITAAISRLRSACEEALFVGVDGHSNIVLIEMNNQIRVNLELIEALGVLLSQCVLFSYAALVLARSSFEYSITTAWVLSPHDPQQWRLRFASVLHDEVKQQQPRTGAIRMMGAAGRHTIYWIL